MVTPRHKIWVTLLITFLTAAGAVANNFNPPKADAIVSFSNNPVFQYSSCDIYQELSRTSFLSFLEKGKVLSMATPLDDKSLQGPVTYHEPLNDWARNLVALEKKQGPGICQRRCQGAAATQDTIYFWELINDNVLWISDEKGRGCYLRIGSGI